MFEPKIITDISMLPKTIETNLAEIEPIIAEKCEFANSLVVDVDSIEDCERADKDAGDLKKLAERIKRFRIDWTATWQSPFDKVIAKCKEYEARLTEAERNLRDKSAVGKDKIKAKKRDELKKIWEEKISEQIAEPYRAASHFSVFFGMMTAANTKGNWLNKGVKVEHATEQMLAELTRCAGVLSTVEAMIDADDIGAREIANLNVGKHFDIAEVVTAINRYKEEQARIKEAQKRAQERVEANRGIVAPPAEEKSVEAVISAPTATPAPTPTPTPDKIETYRIEVRGTRSALKALREWGEKHGVAFHAI